MEHGDEVTLTIKGKLNDHGLTNVEITKTGLGWLPDDLYFDRPGSNAQRITLGFNSDAKIAVVVKSQYHNGVHIDANGRYWMRRPDGWHPMRIAGDPSGHSPNPCLPVQRLSEVRDKRS